MTTANRLRVYTGPKSGPTKRQVRTAGPETDALIQRCIDARLAAKKSQGALAVELGIDRSGITKIETKAHAVLLTRFVRYAKACGLRLIVVPLGEGPA